jgi:hypothetical protein
MKKLDGFTEAYLTTALWASTDDTNPDQGGQPLDDNYGIGDIETETLRDMVQDCRRFQDENAASILDENLVAGMLGRASTAGAQAGRDFWLTRNGHGAGFWDGDWREPAATKLTESAHAFGEYNITATGSGGQVYKT